MTLSERISEQLAKFPPALRALVDAELAAGNDFRDLEIGRGVDQGKVAVVLERPFHVPTDSPPQGILYRERENRDMRVFEFTLPDQSYSLMTVKWKPMQLPKLGPGPPNPTEAHIATMAKRQKEIEAARTAATAAEQNVAVEPPIRSAEQPKEVDPKKRFLASMVMDYEKWHDGIGYDLEALGQLASDELVQIEQILIDHHPRDWRDIEALGQLKSARARDAVEKALKDSDAQVRREAAKYAGAKQDPAKRESLLIKSLRTDAFYGGLSDALDEVEEFHPPAVIETLLRGALNRDGEIAVHFAAMLFFLHGKAEEAFDWNHRPFFLKFNTASRDERKAAFLELCQIIGVDAGKYLRAP